VEPCIDPAQEIQAAGRIHRLGQEKDCFIKRFAFKDSVEEAVVMIHNKIKDKEIAVVDGKLDSDASSKAMLEYAASMTTHDRSDGGPTRTRAETGKANASEVDIQLVHGQDAKPEWSYSSEIVAVTSSQRKQRRLIWEEENAAYEKANTYSYTCTQRACTCCGLFADVPGTFSWKGTGLYAYLDGDKRDAPNTFMSYEHYEARAFSKLPRPPDGWKGLALKQTDNGGELPATSASPPSRLRRAGGAISAVLSRIAGGGDGGGPSSM
jgi:hypothetical protein